MRERDDARMEVLRLRPREPRRAIGAHAHLEEARTQRLVERGHVVVGGLRVDGRDAHPALGQLVLVEAPRREELQRGLLDVALGAIQLLEEKDARAVTGQHVRQRVFGASVLHDGEPDEIGRLEETEVEHGGADAELLGDAADDLALADAGRPFEEHRAARAIRDREDLLEPRAHGDGERTQPVARAWFR